LEDQITIVAVAICHEKTGEAGASCLAVRLDARPFRLAPVTRQRRNQADARIRPEKLRNSRLLNAVALTLRVISRNTMRGEQPAA
jgi:hypothetical protein